MLPVHSSLSPKPFHAPMANDQNATETPGEYGSCADLTWQLKDAGKTHISFSITLADLIFTCYFLMVHQPEDLQ